MALYNYNKEENYKLKTKDGEMYISIISGNGQGGSYLILKDQTPIGANQKTFIGKASENVGKTIQIIVTIQDKLKQTNWTGVHLIVNEGDESNVYSYAEELPADKDIACYNITVKIKK